MINCDDIKELLSAYIDNECSETEKEEINKHLKNCTSCMNEYNSLTVLINKLNDFKEQEMPKDLHDDIMHKIHGMSPKNNKILPKIKRTYSVVAAAIIICVIFGYFGTGMLMKLAVKDSAIELTTTDTASSKYSPMMTYGAYDEATSSSEDSVTDENTADSRMQIIPSDITTGQSENTDTYKSDETSEDSSVALGTAPDTDSIKYNTESTDTGSGVANQTAPDVNSSGSTNSTDTTESPDTTYSLGIADDNYGMSMVPGDDNEEDGLNNMDNQVSGNTSSPQDNNISKSITSANNVDKYATVTSSSDSGNIESNNKAQRGEGVNGTTIIVIILAILILFVPGTLLTLTRRKRPK